METILKVSNLNISLPNNTTIVNNISFEIKSGEVVCFAGDNGAGKSSILKAIMQDDCGGKNITGDISYCGGKNILQMSQNELQDFRSQIAYVPQKDDYQYIGKHVTACDVIMDSASIYSKKEFTKQDVSNLFDKYNLRTYDETTGKPLFCEKSKPFKLSGGQQRLLSLVSAVAVRNDAKLFIIDEPLNNLDFKNAKKISNIITKIHKENPNSAILMVTHCRIFPSITRLITLQNGQIVPNTQPYQCYSCFGVPNSDGYYE